MIRDIFLEALLLILIAAALAAAGYLLRPELLPLTGNQLTGAPVVAEEPELFREIGFEQARTIFEERKALFADARPLIAYEAGHIQGAVHLDPQLMDRWVDRLQAGYPFDHPIVAYCEGPAAPRARELAEQLTWLGFEEVYYLVDGWDVWQAHHMPVDTPRY